MHITKVLLITTTLKWPWQLPTCQSCHAIVIKSDTRCKSPQHVSGKVHSCISEHTNKFDISATTHQNKI